MKELISYFIILMVTGIILGLAEQAQGSTILPEQRIGSEPFVVECTAYCNEGLTASGSQTIEGLTIAGASEWLGCAAVLYEQDEEGGLGEFIGIYQFTDTGYGRDGDILRGETVDLYIPDEAACWQWGRQNVYIQIIDGKG